MTNIGYLFLSLGYEDESRWSSEDILDIEHNYNAFLTYMAEEFALALSIPEDKLNKYIEVTTDMMIRRRKTIMLIEVKK